MPQQVAVTPGGGPVSDKMKSCSVLSQVDDISVERDNIDGVDPKHQEFLQGDDNTDNDNCIIDKNKILKYVLLYFFHYTVNIIKIGYRDYFT